MKLFLYDRKHENIRDEIDIGENPPIELLSKILEMLHKNGVTTRYKDLVIAQGYKRMYVEDQSIIRFIY